MDIDFIKWMVGYAEGFELDELTGYAPYCIYRERRIMLCDMKAWSYFPLLLQRAIEGINSDHDLFIVQQSDTIRVFDYRLNNYKLRFTHKVGRSYTDQPKEQTLKYVYEQEKNNGD